jgi:hypothetical protein
VSQIEERAECVPQIAIEPEFVIRDSTARVVLEKRRAGMSVASR